MTCFPVFWKLAGRQVLICGGGSEALAKIEKLRPFGAELHIFSAHLCREILDMKDITAEGRALAAEDLHRPAFVVAAEDPEENRRIAALCREKNIPVNAVDQPELCDFYFPACFTAGELSVGVSSSGVSPTAAVALRDRFRDSLPEHAVEILDSLPEARQWLRSRCSGKEELHRALRCAAEAAFEKDRPLTETELEACLKAAGTGTECGETGMAEAFR